MLGHRRMILKSLRDWIPGLRAGNFLANPDGPPVNWMYRLAPGADTVYEKAGEHSPDLPNSPFS